NNAAQPGGSGEPVVRQTKQTAPEQRADEEVKQQTDRRVHPDGGRDQRHRLMQRRHHEGRDETGNDTVADPVGDRDVGTHGQASAACWALLHSAWKKPFSPIRQTSVSVPRSFNLRAASTANSIASSLVL